MAKKSGNSYSRGYEAGFSNALPVGREQGISEYYQYFQGLSIIIPASNQLEGLRASVDNIVANVRGSYEIIVIDHGSKDGTERYLSTLTGRVKTRRFDAPLRFPAAVNQGLRLARGNKLLLMNADHSLAERGLPDTLWGDDKSQVSLPQEQPEFLLLMGKAEFRKLGYLDESLEDRREALEDYAAKARRLGLALAVQGNGPTLPDIEPDVRGGCINHYYPSYVLVRGCGETRYWIEEGIRHPVENGEGLQAVRVSQLELKNWPVGSRLDHEECLKKMATLSSIPSPYGPLAEGILVRDGRGVVYQSFKGSLRPLNGSRALEAWELGKRPIYSIGDDILNMYVEGTPIHATPVMHSANL